MEAKLKPSYPNAVIRALEGQEYVKYEWRPVLPGREAEAQKHPDLETREPESTADQIGPVETEPGKDISTEMPAVEPGTGKAGKGRGKKAQA